MPRVVIKEDRSDIRKKVMQLQKKMYPAFDNDIEKEIITGSMYNILSDVDEELNFLSCKGVELINLNELLEFRREGGYKNILMMYQEAHSVSGFIIREYGKERFMKLVLSGQSNEDFMSILGVDIETINRKWLSTITCEGKRFMRKKRQYPLKAEGI